MKNVCETKFFYIEGCVTHFGPPTSYNSLTISTKHQYPLETKLKIWNETVTLFGLPVISKFNIFYKIWNWTVTLCGLPIIPVLNVFNRTPISTGNKTKNLKKNQFAVLCLDGGANGKCLFQQLVSSRSLSVSVSPVLLLALFWLCLDFNHEEFFFCIKTFAKIKLNGLQTNMTK